MKIARAAHLPWAFFFVVASGAATVFYLAQFHPQRLPAGWRFFGDLPPAHATIGGTRLGLLFGTIAFGIFIFATLLGLRKKLPHFPLGHVQTWLRAHIWLTLLTVPLILFHCGFHLGSPMTTLLMGLYAVVMLSGIFGLILQQKMPAWMKERLGGEIVYEQIPNIRAQLATKARRLREAYEQDWAERAAERKREAEPKPLPKLAVVPVLNPAPAPARGGAGNAAALIAADTAETEAADPLVDLASEKLLADFISRQILPYLEARRGEKMRLGHGSEAGDTFRYLKARVAAAYRPRVDEMERWCAERRHLDLQTRMQHWLHGWLFVHVPVSFLLLLVTAWHAFVTLFRY